MPNPDPSDGSQRLLLLPPTARDAAITQSILRQQSIETLLCTDIDQVCREAARGVGAVLLAEEFLAGSQRLRLMEFLDAQPAWSDLPLIVLTLANRPTSDAVRLLQQSANVTLVSRPVQVESFLSAVNSRLRDRRRQYTVQSLLTSLSTSERQVRQLADVMPQMVFAADPQGYCDYFNQRTFDYIGSDVDPYGDGWVSVVHSADQERGVQQWATAIKTGKPYQVEFRVRNAATGKYRWHLVRALPIRDENGQITRWYGTCTDVHEQKNAENRLNRALEEAATANQSKSEFIANMSHEIRTPMTAVLGYADLLAEQETDPEKLDHLDTIQRNGEFLLEIINDMLDLSKIEAGKLDISRESFEPHRIVFDVHSMMEGRAAEKKLSFSVKFPEPVPETIRSDPKRLRQILINLVGNAIKFTDTGSVELIVRQVDETMAFDVRDTGIGMTQGQCRRLFQPYTQGDASVDRRFGGTGLGLAISQRLAGLLGGEITVESEYGKGSCFTCTVATGNVSGVRLITPAKTPQRETSHRETAETTSTDAVNLSCTVLVVDDRRDVRFLAGHLLERSGAAVEYAEDGLQATNIIRRSMETNRAVDIVLMDMQMPRMDGYQAASAMRELGFENPIIALTADAMQGDMDRCLASGCNAYVSKPIDSSELYRVVQSYSR